MTRQSFSHTREWLGQMRQTRIPQLSPAGIDQAMRISGIKRYVATAYG
jgi:hypothetical protein